MQHGTAVSMPALRTGTHRDGEVGRLGGLLARPSAPGNLDQHLASVLPRWPGRDRPGRADAQPDHTVIVFERHRVTMTQQRQHRAVLQQYLGLETPNAAVGGMTHEHIDQVRPQPAPPARCNGHGEVTVAVVAGRVARVCHDLAIDHRHGNEPATIADRRPFEAPVLLRCEGTEESAATIGPGQIAVQRTDRVGVGGVRRPNDHGASVREFDRVDDPRRRDGITHVSSPPPSRLTSKSTRTLGRSVRRSPLPGVSSGETYPAWYVLRPLSCVP